jgi:hypothetical protein
MGSQVLGMGDCIFMIGMAHCEKLDEVLPFIAFGPYEKIAAGLGNIEVGKPMTGGEDVGHIVSEFSTHGSVVFLNTFETCVDMMNAIKTLVDHAVDTEWVLRETNKITVN